ncbi:MAG TPA: 16S rRNA (adenine(1518)-N(6)/adenine(1519)-N(6))-dimethyltransferase RsmA [Phycisphaerae bacterium]|nr:ribosomal RNA small subunit methyltransferase A [Phycisphaerales bacterium]HRX83800.1 16S rRNA (adenine(1518)-N(6)/adenine(1519)-N(6))-dimethyltransferase RsmA [Phycisphaerae bacterium]
MGSTVVQSKRDIEAILASAGLRPDKHLGQHFLIDGNLMRKLLASAEIAPGDAVLEVGGGTGGLSDLLAAEAERLVVVEIDHDLAPLLQARYADQPHVSVLHMDVLANKSTIDPLVLATLSEEAAPGAADRRYLLVANLPYHVATPLLMNLLTATPRFARMCFTIQLEVADRLFAQAGSRDFGPLAIVVQTACTLRRIAQLPPQAFWPPPKVASSMIRLDHQPHDFEQEGQLAAFSGLVRAAFAHRRKTVRYNLARYLNEQDLATALTIVDGQERAERIGLDTWITLGKALLNL